MIAVDALENEDVRTVYMTAAVCNEPGEKGSLANVCVTEWCDVDCIPDLVSSTNERGGDR